MERGEVNSSYVRVMFIGPGGVGKSSLLHRLMRKHLPSAHSTQLAKTMSVKLENVTSEPDFTNVPVTSSTLCAETVTENQGIKSASTTWAVASEDPQTLWQEITDKDEIRELVGYVNFVVKKTNITIKDFGTLDKTDTSESMSGSNKRVKGFLDNIISEILLQAKKNPHLLPPEKEVLIRVWDCGGQHVFLDVLPAFITPRTMFLLMFDASRSLTDRCLIRTFKNGEIIDQQEHNATTLQLLHEWMASIHAMLGMTSRIIPVGTHGADPSVDRAKSSSQVNSECSGKAFSHLVNECAIVDNTRDENVEAGFNLIRKQIHEFASQDLRLKTPVAWVLFRKVFQKVVKESDNWIVPYQMVVDTAKMCKIPPEEVATVIKFYHNLAVFLYYEDVPGFCDYVIADPQQLISLFAKILTVKGLNEFPCDDLWKLLQEKGVLLEPLYNKVWANFHSELEPQFLVDLLVHFLLAAPIDNVEEIVNIEGKKYFFSCVLPSFNSDQTQPTNQSSVTENAVPVTEETTPVTKKAAPIHLLFNTYYVPPGFFSRLVTTLVSNNHFRLSFQGMYRDRITLFYGTAHCEIDEVTLTKCSSSIKVEIVRTKRRHLGYLPFYMVCHEILDFITEFLPNILHWLKGIRIEPAFLCNCCPKEGQHYIRIQYASTIHISVRCDKEKYVDLTTSHRFWLKFPDRDFVCSCFVTIIILLIILRFLPLLFSVLIILRMRSCKMFLKKFIAKRSRN